MSQARAGLVPGAYVLSSGLLITPNRQLESLRPSTVNSATTSETGTELDLSLAAIYATSCSVIIVTGR
jgi:hypothetical protein